MPSTAVSTLEAPAAIGPYSQAIVSGNTVYTSGQIGLVPGEKRLISDDVEAQTQQVLRNLAAVLNAAGATPQNVVKTTIFLTDLADFAVVNRVYGEFFSGIFPARSTVQVAALPLAAKVEIEAIAVVDAG